MEKSPHVRPEGGEGEVSGFVQEVSAIWAECLGSPEVGADDDFFALGGNSLTGIKIIDRIAQDYGVEVSVRDFYLARVPARVAELIERGRART